MEFGIFDVRGIQTNDSRKDTILDLDILQAIGGRKENGRYDDGQRGRNIFGIFRGLSYDPRLFTS